MPKSIGILHYSSPPGIGGVESVIAYHARGLAKLGYQVHILSGNGGTFDPRVQTHINPLFGSKHPDVLAVKAELDAGKVSPAFDPLVDKIEHDLQQSLAGCDCCIVHNVHTLHKNIPLTAALARLTSRGKLRFIAWCHDLAWTNEQYQSEMHAGYPWDLLREIWPNTAYVTVSDMRKTEMVDLFSAAPERIQVIPAGVDPAGFFRWTPTTVRLVDQLNLMSADGLLLLPARLTRRKNIERALEVLAEIRQASQRDFRLIVTGPPGPHNPANAAYLNELLALRHQLQIDDCAHFLYQYGVEEGQPLLVDDDTIADLYRLSDALLFPSLQEGFGIPVLEAGLSGIPAFCANLPPIRETGRGDIHYFDPLHTPANQIAAQIGSALTHDPVYRLRVRVRQDFRWDAILQNQLVPLLEGS
ncbi:MAG: glycosyltransferase family 4 protein [Anaerolineae bacterium]|nr:glycosyltransferase family 4 protein [Anaerolineae bacterium]